MDEKNENKQEDGFAFSDDGGVNNKMLNIHPSYELFTLLAEINYLLAFRQLCSTEGNTFLEDIPQVLWDFYEDRDDLWQRKIKLMKIIHYYNAIQETIFNDGKFKLIASEIDSINNLVAKACQTVTWQNYDNDLIDKIYCECQELSLQERYKARLTQCEESRLLISKLLKENLYLLCSKTRGQLESDCNVQEFLLSLPDEQKQKCNKHLIDVYETICNEVYEGMKISLEYLYNEMTINTTNPTERIPSVIGKIQKNRQISEHSRNQWAMEYNASLCDQRTFAQTPLFEVELQLSDIKICFKPSFEENEKNNFQQFFNQLLDDIKETYKYLLRSFDGDSLLSQFKNNNEIAILRAEVEAWEMNSTPSATMTKSDLLKKRISAIREKLNGSISAANLYASQFEIYSHLWNEKYIDVLKKNLQDARNVDSTCYYILDVFKQSIEYYKDLHENIDQLEEKHCIQNWLSINVKPLKYSLLNSICKWIEYFKERLFKYMEKTLQKYDNFIERGFSLLQMHIKRDDLGTLLQILTIIRQIHEHEAETDNIFKPLKEAVALLKSYGVCFNAEFLRKIDHLPTQWNQLKTLATTKSEALRETKLYQQERIATLTMIFSCYVQSFAKRFHRMTFFKVPCPEVYSLCDRICQKLNYYFTTHRKISNCSSVLEVEPPDYDVLQKCKTQIKHIKQLWDYVNVIESSVNHWRTTSWLKLDIDDIENYCKQFTRDLRSLDKSIRDWAPYLYIVRLLKELNSSFRTVTELQNPALTERHWMELMTELKMSTTYSSDYLLSSLGLYKHEEEIKNFVDRAVKEMAVVKMLDEINKTWSSMEFYIEPHHRRQEINMLKVSEEFIEILDDNQIQLQNMTALKHGTYISEKINYWQNILAKVEIFINSWLEVQRKWMYLESIFIGSPDIRAQLSQDTMHFEEIDENFRSLLNKVVAVRTAKAIVLEHGHMFATLIHLQEQLTLCEKALYEYLETKRMTFPRFYFISSADLLHILSNGSNPQIIDQHLIKLFDSILRLQYNAGTTQAIGVISKENDEYVQFISSHIECSGKVELWLTNLIEEMRYTLHELFDRGLNAYAKKPRENWIFDWPAQVALCCSQIYWTAEVNKAFAWIEEGYEAAMRDFHKQQVSQLNALISLLMSDLKPGDRQKIMTMCTIDVHSRDVVNKIISSKVDNSSAFPWQSQLRHRWSSNDDWKGTASAGYAMDCFANICDAEFQYAYEYLGNTTRLVITPLTDRCYITLTQVKSSIFISSTVCLLRKKMFSPLTLKSLHLVMGGATAGPAGTGKTETTKDLGRALGVMVYVFNCSEQMDYKSCANIYKGLAQTGAWGCFDEFNRISVEVLSVIAIQVKTIQEAIKMFKKKFMFMGEEIALKPSVGIFITMNPGYAGRTELPENLKTLFRPCAMIVPDFALICEIMLMAEGFQDAYRLARKFITLYTLCKELLSKQDHYDWGLRAIKSVLVVAGALKRDDRSRPEEQVLMRALRDFNIPKIVTEDVSIFTGLIGDLFPAIDVPRKRRFDFEKTVRLAITEMKLQPEQRFLMKVVQLQELLDVRHSVFIVGNAGTGKTKTWQTLYETYHMQGLKPVCNVLNPKALTNDELFGIVNAKTREWKDGLFSSIMRDQANMTQNNPKWIVLDGDIDPMWIESLNTLMDDNRILTLASNERISLKKEMRLIFEVGHLKAATPATVSRAGILYINTQDLSWSSYVLSWLETRTDPIERSILTTLFEKYYPRLMQHQQNFKRIIPIPVIAMIQISCHLLESLLETSLKSNSIVVETSRLSQPSNSQHNNNTAETMETHLALMFTYATMWGFGSILHEDQIIDWRREFHKWWTSEFKDIKLPSLGTIFDYYLDVQAQKFTPWADLACQTPCNLIDLDTPLQNILIRTAETTRLTYFLETLMERNLPCMLVGTSGCGKSSIFRELFKKYTSYQDAITIKNSSASTVIQEIHFNFYTTSEILQKILEYPLEKKSGKCYGPIGSNRRLIYFINDLNMPKVDAYGTVQAHTIIRQFMDYRQWNFGLIFKFLIKYDRQHLRLKNIRKCQFVACMNHTAGSFTIDPRLQRHFCIFSLAAPSEQTLHYIYGTVLSSHLENSSNNFSKEIKMIGDLMVRVGIYLHRRVEYLFPATALKFHYTFNMRDLTNIYQNVVNSVGVSNAGSNAALTNFTGTICSKPSDLIRLYVHEAFRVYHDRLVDQFDIKSFKSSIRDVFKKDFEDFDEEYVFSEPLIYCHFTQSLVDQRYMPISGWKRLYESLMEALISYNDVSGHMNLVLFEDAMKHLCRINRILESPCTNALLVGVGGSGKQTLTRLASFISSLSIFQVQIKRGFCSQDMKDEMAALYMKVGLKNIATVFLISDTQIPDESILIYINDFLASGEIPDLFSDDQLESIMNTIRGEVKQSGILDIKENCWRYFVMKVRRLLKVVLCFSPVGHSFRRRARKFPAIIKHTSIDWFHEWPDSALESVSQKFLNEVSENILPHNFIKPISKFMAYVHGTVNQISKVFKQNEKRFNYTTPKTFLEYIFLYRKLLIDTSDEYTKRINRLESGMAKLAECSLQVEILKDQLATQQIQLNAKNSAADKLIGVISSESEKVGNEKNIASEEEKRVKIIEEDVLIKTKTCEEDLRKAEPALVAAQAALNTLNKNNLTELKSFGSPPKAVVNVCAAVMVLLAVNGKIPHNRSWKAAKLMMVRVDQFLNDLINYNKENIHPNIIDLLEKYLEDPEFNPDKVVQKSVAAAGLCAWVINIYRYYQIFLFVGPKQRALKDSQEELKNAREHLHFLKSKIISLEHKLGQIQAEFEEAVNAKQKCQAEADKTANTIDVAHRLVNGLVNENIRWKQSVQSLIAKIATLPGDMLLICSFLSYVGSFTRRYRDELQQKLWIPNFKKLQPAVPHTDAENFLMLFTDDAQIAVWNNEGLPMDRMSTENATILVNSTRWPLMIDPQLQGIKWIKNRFGEALIVIRLSERNFLEKLESAITKGDTVLMEQIEETVDTVLDPLMSRFLIKKGHYIRIGDKELEFNPNFRLILQTKLANPHFKPEMQAQTTLINFTVTPDGLEEQLLAEVVKMERPDLEEMKAKLTVQQNKFKIYLKDLEDDLLARLASAKENILDDNELVRNLEATKRTTDDIEIKVNETRATAMQIDDARNMYRPAANRASLLYFILFDLGRINPIYRFSLKSYMHVFKQAIKLAAPESRQNKRVALLVESITLQTFYYTIRGLFEVDKLTFTTHMTLRLMANSKYICAEEIDFLLRYPHDPNTSAPVDFINSNSWGGIKSLSLLEDFYGLDKDIETCPKRWRKFITSEAPELEQLPGEWKHRTRLQKLCILRAVRPDRISNALRDFVEQTMGKEYGTIRSYPLGEILKEISAYIPVVFILSPGVDPIRDVEYIGSKLGFTSEAGTLINISLGQGQEIVAEQAISAALKTGQQWVVLQNIHLVKHWLPTLDKLIENISSERLPIAESNFRLFISLEPAPDPQYHIIPQGILESSLKIVNEPPSGMAANLHKAWDNFSPDTLETCTQEAEFKSILFALCFFHSVCSQRYKFGPLGWNKTYPFNMGDLTISASVLRNYLEKCSHIPWEDLRYLFGEIMYGGHITDDWDRRLCQTYLEEILQQDLIDGEFELCPGFPSPPNLDFQGYHDYISEVLPVDSPTLYGLHPNAEIGFLTNMSEQMLKTIFELQPRQSDLSTNYGAPREELVRIMIDDFLDKLRDEFNLQALLNRVESKTPFVVVALQESERMNMLIHEIKRSLRELLLGLKGELTLTTEMERLDHAIFYDQIPETWMNLAYPSMLNLQSWFADLLHRIKELSLWLNDFKLPCTIWLGGLFSPQSFLTAIMQESARKRDLPLDRMCLHCDVTKKDKDSITLPPIEGAFVHGLFLDGASWDCQLNSIVPLHPKELFCAMPIIYIKSVVQSKHDLLHIYECPLYKTRFRESTYVWTFNLKTCDRPAKWILGGVALLLQP
uniref:AAA+ ATPase domain-containing protein n=1 Tax=Glossina austeni TaxID=7395 RepID=A0A1A9VM43_GLOAU